MDLVIAAVVKAVLLDVGPEGDLLVFLPGVGEIRSVQKVLSVSGSRGGGSRGGVQGGGRDTQRPDGARGDRSWGSGGGSAGGDFG